LTIEIDKATVDAWRGGLSTRLDAVSYLTLGRTALDEVCDPARTCSWGLRRTPESQPGSMTPPSSVRPSIRVPQLKEPLHTLLYRFDPPPPEAHRRTSHWGARQLLYWACEGELARWSLRAWPTVRNLPTSSMWRSAGRFL